tara:strand:- start:40589 stop:41392 length:804 start_codon:yes stop_codon:yes gene_type:complete
VSRAVRDFEDNIGVALFERGAAGVKPTDAGAKFLAQVAPALQEIGHAVVLAGAAGRVETGKLRIGIMTSIAGGFLRSVLDGYRNEYPGIAIDIRDGSRGKHIAGIHAGDLDIAFLAGSDEIAGCDLAEMWRERIFVALRADHSLARNAQLDWPELRKERFLVTRYDPGQDLHDYIVRRVADHHTANPAIEYREVSQETLMHVVALGEGITVVSEAWSYLAFPGVALVPFAQDNDIMPFSAVWSPSHDNPSMRRFLSFARSKAQMAER